MPYDPTVDIATGFWLACGVYWSAIAVRAMFNAFKVSMDMEGRE